jgi:pimeloyl-ACP methyl ester carboxylesterase
MLFVYGYNHVDTSCGAAQQLGSVSEEVTFETSDGLVLAGSYLPSRNRAAVIVLPAGGRCGSHEHAQMLAEHGYGVLMFDLRGTGDSEGDPYHWGAEKDVAAAVDFLGDRPDVDPERIGGLGLSLGGELMLQTAAETPSLRAVVSEGAGIRSIRESWDRPGPAKWLSAPFWLTWTAGSVVSTNQGPPPDLEDLMSKIAPRPIFLIYSGHPVGGEELNPELYEAAGEPKSLWRIGDARHTGGLTRFPDEYERHVVDFFDTALLAN